MAVILIEEDGFHAKPEEIAAANSERTNRYNGLWIRRPTRGIQASPNTFSTIQVKTSGGDFVELINSSAPSDRTKAAPMTANYILQSISESREEKLQLLETFGQAYGFFFGERPRVVQFSGTLVNTVDFNWRSEWWANYENVFRGTKLVERNARLYITYDDIVIEGYMLNAAIGQQAEGSPNLVSLNFSMWVTGYHDSSDIGAATFPGYTSLRNAVSENLSGRGTTTVQSTELRRDELLREHPELASNPQLLAAILEGEGEGDAADSTDLDTIRSDIRDNIDEYVYSSNDHGRRRTAASLSQWITSGWEDPTATPETPTEVHDKSFGVLKKNLSGNLQGAQTQAGGQMLAANGEASAGSVDGAPTHGGLVVRDQMLPTGVEAPRFDQSMGSPGNGGI